MTINELPQKLSDLGATEAAQLVGALLNENENLKAQVLSLQDNNASAQVGTLTAQLGQVTAERDELQAKLAKALADLSGNSAD